MIIREAITSDLEALSEMGAEFYRSGGLPGQFVPSCFATFWSERFFHRDGTILVGEVGNTAVGTIGGLVYPDPNNGDLIAQEMFWWVNRGFRGKDALRLLEAFETWARLKGAKRLVMTAVHGLRDRALGRLYAGRGYRELETNFVRGI